MSRFNRRLGSTTKVNLETVYFLVQSLDRQEKQHFSLYNKMVKGKPHFLELFERMMKMKTYSEKGLLKGKLSSLKRANLVAKELAGRIITSQLHQSGSNSDKLNFIVKAMEYGMWGLVPNILGAEMTRCYQWEEYYQLLSLHELRSELFRLYGIEMEYEAEQKIVNRDGVVRLQDQIEQLHQDVKSWRIFLLIDPVKNVKWIDSQEEKYKDFFPYSRKARRLFLDLKVKMAIGINDPDRVYEALSHKIRHLSINGSMGTVVEALLDLNLMVYFLSLLGNFQEAREFVAKIPEWPTLNQGERMLAIRIEAEARISVVEYSWDLAFTRESLSWMTEHEAHLPKQEYYPLLYKLALSFFANGAWNEAGKLLSQLDHLPPQYFQLIAWPTLCLIVANHLERGNPDMVDYYEDRGFQAAKEVGLKLPETCFRFFRRMAVLGPDDDLKLEYAKRGEWFLPILNDFDEYRHLWEFDVFYWLEAKFKGMTMVEFRAKEAGQMDFYYGARRPEKQLGVSLEAYVYPNWYIPTSEEIGYDSVRGSRRVDKKGH